MIDLRLSDGDALAREKVCALIDLRDCASTMFKTCASFALGSQNSKASGPIASIMLKGCASAMLAMALLVHMG